jgi:alpha-acetolactate decarboxylase
MRNMAGFLSVSQMAQPFRIRKGAIFDIENTSYFWYRVSKREKDMFNSDIIVSIITGILTLIGVIITNSESNRKIEHRLEVSQAITDTKLENLTQEVRKQTDFAMKIPVLETRVSNCEVDIKELKDSIHG